MSICPRCGAEFGCGMTDAGAVNPCWCMQQPPIPADVLARARAGNDKPACYCPDCLRALATLAGIDGAARPA